MTPEEHELAVRLRLDYEALKLELADTKRQLLAQESSKRITAGNLRECQEARHRDSIQNADLLLQITGLMDEKAALREELEGWKKAAQTHRQQSDVMERDRRHWYEKYQELKRLIK